MNEADTCRMRKDKGLNGDLDRLPMLTWVLFPKFLDDHEAIREDRAKMKRQRYRSGPTEHIWYYEQPLPEGRKNYTKTAPLQFEAFADCLKWWPQRKENERAWKVAVEKVLENNCNLDIKNPNAKDDFEHLPPEQLADDILQKELRIAEIMREIKELLGRKP